MSILLGNGNGTFTTKSTLGVAYPHVMVVADFNGDGILDLATDGDVLLGNGDGTFTSKSAPEIGPGLVVRDFNGDGIPDLATTDVANMTILLGNGDGTFTKSTLPNLGGPLVQQTSRGKFDRLQRTTAGFTDTRLDGYGLRCSLPTRPRVLASSIRFLSIGTRLCSTLPSDPASRRRPCASLILHLHQVG